MAQYICAVLFAFTSYMFHITGISTMSLCPSTVEQRDVVFTILVIVCVILTTLISRIN